MHDSVMAFGQRVLTPERIKGARVLEVGSLDVNGSLRSHVEALQPSEYVGMDLHGGRGVDVVGVENLPTHLADVVICTEVLEHAEDWKALVSLLKDRVKTGGLILVTTRGPGFPRHDYPGDFWRFTVEDIGAAFADCTTVELESDPLPGHPGVLALFRKPRGFAESDLSKMKVEKAPST